MRKIIYCLVFISVFISCKKEENKLAVKNDRMELIPEPDEAERLEYEKSIKQKSAGCILEDPDTSILGINIRDPESAVKIIGEKDKIDDLDQYHLYSNLENETLTLVQHPGDVKYQISIFKVTYSNRVSYDYRQIKVDAFKTGKGIHLGMSKSDIIKKIGKCYVPIDSTKEYIQLYYKIELPNDTKSKFLEKNGMPVYYASYNLCKDKLEKFEFGFEYP